MSSRIEEILEVIEEVRDNFRTATGSRSIRRLRIQAVHSAASRRGIYPTTASNKFRRELRPEINGTAAFDRLLESWLVSGSDELASVLRQHTSDSADLELIETIFISTSDPDLLLAQEFGFGTDDLSFKEGRAQLRLHLTRERNRSLVARAKERWNREHGGQPCCSICGFSFAQTYGNVGEGFIQAHHIQAISSIEPDTLVTLDDLVPVCSNCHSILHRYHPWPAVEELRRIVSRQRDVGPA